MAARNLIIPMGIRDYERDIADGVNNSIYFNYLDYARHSMLKKIV